MFKGEVSSLSGQKMADCVTEQVAYIILNACMLKVEIVWYISFLENHLSVDWSRNLDSLIGGSVGLVIWRSEVRVPVQVQSY